MSPAKFLSKSSTGRGFGGVALALVLSLCIGTAFSVAAAPPADAQNPCSGTVIYVAQVQADPWSDWDGDGISNSVEVNNGTPPCALPCNYLSAADVQLNPRGDWDNDGVDNMSEYNNGFNPCVYEQFNVVPSSNRPSAPVVVTATAVPPRPTAVPPRPTAVPVPTSTAVPPATSVPVTSVPVAETGTAATEPSTLPIATATPQPTPTPLEGELAQARALLEEYDRAQEEAARATPTPQPSATPEPTASPEPGSDSEQALNAPGVAAGGDGDSGNSASSADDAPAESSGGVTIAVEQPCTAGFGFDGQCLKLLPITMVMLAAGSIVGWTWWADRRKHRPEYPSLKLFE